LWLARRTIKSMDMVLWTVPNAELGRRLGLNSSNSGKPASSDRLKKPRLIGDPETPIAKLRFA
jgi:hypothetical protein